MCQRTTYMLVLTLSLAKDIVYLMIPPVLSKVHYLKSSKDYLISTCYLCPLATRHQTGSTWSVFTGLWWPKFMTSHLVHWAIPPVFFSWILNFHFILKITERKLWLLCTYFIITNFCHFSLSLGKQFLAVKNNLK